MAGVEVSRGERPHYTLTTSYMTAPVPSEQSDLATQANVRWNIDEGWTGRARDGLSLGGSTEVHTTGLNSTAKGVLIGMLSAFGSAGLVGFILCLVYFFRFTNRGRIILDRIGRPGEYDDEQAFLREEEDALTDMDDLQRAEYLRAKGGLSQHA